MKCPSCEIENKEGVKKCKKCGFDLSTAQVWIPTWQWHMRTLTVIFVALGIIYFVLRKFVA